MIAQGVLPFPAAPPPPLLLPCSTTTLVRSVWFSVSVYPNKFARAKKEATKKREGERVGTPDHAYAALSSKISRTDRMNWDSRRRRRCEAVTKAENPGGDELGARTRTAYLSARRKERIELPDYGGPITFSDFVNHPSGVEALLNTRALHSFRPLDSNTYRCTLQKIQFLKFEVAPVLDLRVTPTREGCTVEMVDCRFEGSGIVEQQNHVFSAFVRNHITWERNGSEPCLDVDVNLKVSLEVYTKPFNLLPLSAVEKPGNLLVPLLVEQLLDDYRTWVSEQFRVSS
ncbi:uncharacterized protein LOC103723532 isoform X2 [Phoenix dactylifera]|uniref:Uncharacterized protein LOC103723532 isoform X2 n=1 Tax=Phoenix dactylifera TaxID=42345 RepID=A0A8B7D413_PHODC|nr:uncharacterized protein LOC103723532 isoform X2 [Phoenix dactylifera]